jgi:CO/xanthine dehydrogenase FAD-binding subunit
VLRKLRKFEYVRPHSVPEAVGLLQDYQEQAAILAGGTDLLCFMKLGSRQAKYVVDVKAISGLDHLSWDPVEGLRIGCLFTLQAVIRHPIIRAHVPMLEDAVKAVGHPQIRRRATVAGSICTASPSGDLAPSLLALQARITVTGPGGPRTIPLDEVFSGPFKTVLSPADVLTDILVPALPPRSAGAYCWQPKITAIDETLASAAAVVTLNGGHVQDVRLGLGSVAPTPMRAREAEAFLKGKAIGNGLWREAADIAAAESRPRTRADYRRDITKVLVERALNQATTQAMSRAAGTEERA